MSQTDNIQVELFSAKSSKTGKSFEAVKLTIGEFDTLVFPKSRLDMKEIKRVLGARDLATAGKIDLNEDEAPAPAGMFD